jgi:hypothetical protein
MYTAAMMQILGTLLSVLAAAEPAPPVAAVIVDELPGLDRAFAKELAADVAAAGYAVREVDAEGISKAGGLAGVDLLVVSHARGLPAASAGPIEAHLRAGGDILALGLPAWEEPVVRVGGKWMSRKGYEQALAGVVPERTLIDFGAEDLSRWRRVANPGATGARHEIDRSDGAPALRVRIENLTGWDVFGSPPIERPFPPGHVLTCFEASGGPATRQLAVEWIERDGSRWIAVVDIEEKWKRYALPPEAFLAWEPPPSRRGRDDRLRPADAVRITFGLAFSHTGVEGGRHEFAVRGLGTAPSPFGDTPPPPPGFAAPHLEGLSPSWLFHPIHGPAEIARTHAQNASGGIAGIEPADIRGLHPRPQGAGFGKGRPWRWEPFLEARAPDGDHRGYLAALIIHLAAPFRGAVTASFTPTSPGFYRRPAIREPLRQILKHMRRGVFFAEGGCDRFTVFEGQSVHLGARAVNFGKSPLDLETRMGIIVSPDRRMVLFEKWPVHLEPGAESAVDPPYESPPLTASGFVEVVLDQNGMLIDGFKHEIAVVRPKAKPSFIEARDGGFFLDGKPWKAHGVNYMPSSGVAQPNGEIFENWLGAAAYNPEVIDRDLRRVKALGLNAVSVFVYRRALEAGNLFDFLRRCEELGLKVNLSLRPGTPMDFRWKDMKELIEGFRLAENDTVFAYDLAWEPSHLDGRHQRSYDGLWAEWVAKRYGSFEAAERAWGVPLPRDGGKPRVPPVEMLVRDGEWRRLVAGYRSFLDDLVGERYAEARRLVRSIDPHHPVSFRMQHAGDPTLNWDALLPYDFPGLAGAVDIWEPEAYGRIGDWDRVKAGRFTADWARLWDAGKPLVWAEMGSSSWDMSRMAQNPSRIEFQARYHRDFYRMMIESGADGIFFWWWPGGFRFGENSDFGIIEPDGTDRPVTRVIREEGPKFLAAPKPPAPDFPIEVDRDRDARGLFGIYEAAGAAYWKAIAEGKTPGLRHARRSGGAEPR